MSGVTKHYYAHSGRSADRSDWQELPDHLEATAALSAERAQFIGLGAAAALAGRFHDFGKYDPRFDRVLNGENVRVEHSTAGGAFLLAHAPPAMRLVAEVLAYAILGHHAGLPDRLGAEGSLARRLEQFVDRVPAGISEATTVDLTPAGHELRALMRPGTAGFDLSVAARMIFSCLVDADFRDTERFYARLDGLVHDRDWPTLAARLPDWRARFDAHMAGFAADSDLNRLRADILGHVRGAAGMAPGLFTLTVPTGGGKTLASLGFALDHAARHGHRRIIYAIPYTSIIDQTAKIFGDLLGDGVLEHHSAIEEERLEKGDREKRHLAMEDWAAPLVVTTNVQFFESLFAARPSRCRKLHNIAGSVIVLDEAQTLPRELLLPVLRMLDTLCAHYRCSVVLCTATQPAFDSRQLGPGGLALQGRELAPDPDALAARLRRARIVQGGEMNDDALLAGLAATPQGFVIVNSRAHALDLYRAARRSGLEGVIHLTTRQYPAHRRAIIAEITRRLADGSPCRLIATSLIEAGVDLDFPKGWRAEAGLDSIVQAAGRVNRNGKRPVEDSTLTVFRAPDRPIPREIDTLSKVVRRIAARHADLLDPAAIRDWFEEVYWGAGPDRLGQPMVASMIATPSDTNFRFRSTAEAFRMIETTMLPVIVPGDDEARAWVEKLGFEAVRSGQIARALQPYVVQVPATARALLVGNGHASFHAPALRGDQFCVLDDLPLYHADSGLWWEDAEYLANEACLI